MKESILKGVKHIKMINTKGCKVNSKELKIGRAIEMEHTNSPKVAKRIATQHLCEFPQYYTKGLVPMEKRLSSQINSAKSRFGFGNKVKGGK